MQLIFKETIIKLCIIINILMAFLKNLIKFVENKISRVSTINHKDIDFYKIINKVISEFYKLHTQKVRYAAILIFCILL